MHSIDLDTIRASARLAKYRFDELISSRRGQIVALVVVGLAIIVGVSPIVVYSNHTSFLGSLYETAVDILDPKIEMPRTDKSDTYTFLWISRGCTFIVFVLTSLYANVMVGFVVDWILVKMEAVDKGTHAIVETNHTVMLGWGDKSIGFLREICLANESEGGGVVVVLSHRPKDELEMEIHAMVALRGSRVVCCTGNPLFAADLLRVSIHRARSITIMSTHTDTSESDDALVRVLLTLKSLSHPLEGHIVADVGQLDNKQFMRVIGGDIMEALVSRHIVGRLVVLCSRSPHLGRVYNSLLGFGGHEFYLNEWPECIGVPFGDLYMRFESAIPIGLRTKTGQVLVKPRQNRLVEEGDAIIVLAEDNDSYWPEDGPIDIPPASSSQDPFEKQPLPTPPKRILLCGWRRDLHTILKLLQHLSLPGTVVDLVNPAEVDERLDTFHADGLDLADLTNLRVTHIVANSASKRQLTSVRVGSYDCIMVMTDKEHENEPMSSDSYILKSVMLLRSMEVKQKRRVMYQVPCVAEVLDTRTQKTIRQNPFIDAKAEWINSNDLVSRMLAMVSENRFVNAILDDVLGDHGSTFDVLPASRYSTPYESLSFWQIAQRASAHYNEIACGYVYLVKTSDDAAPVVLNPKDKSTPRCWDKFSIVVLRDSAHRSTFSSRDELRWKINVLRSFRPPKTRSGNPNKVRPIDSQTPMTPAPGEPIPKAPNPFTRSASAFDTEPLLPSFANETYDDDVAIMMEDALTHMTGAPPSARRLSACPSEHAPPNPPDHPHKQITPWEAATRIEEELANLQQALAFLSTATGTEPLRPT